MSKILRWLFLEYRGYETKNYNFLRILYSIFHAYFRKLNSKSFENWFNRKKFYHAVSCVKHGIEKSYTFYFREHPATNAPRSYIEIIKTKMEEKNYIIWKLFDNRSRNCKEPEEITVWILSNKLFISIVV